jgi:adenosylmethionine-8-amino-7-oxononanoate aminotransferase
MLTYPPAVLAEMRAICAARGTLFIADEVMTGWGRTGTLLACEQAGVVPDILCQSKGLTGGAVPLAVTMASEAIWDAHYSQDRAKTFFHSSSYTANPIACAAAAANLAIWREEPVLERVATLAARQEERLDRLAEHPAVANARRCGTIAALELGVAEGTYLNALGPQLLARFRDADLLLRPLGNTVYVMPPYCIGESELDAIYAAISAAADWVAQLG